jgi:hypothetical protein
MMNCECCGPGDFQFSWAPLDECLFLFLLLLVGSVVVVIVVPFFGFINNKKEETYTSWRGFLDNIWFSWNKNLMLLVVEFGPALPSCYGIVFSLHYKECHWFSGCR